MTSPTTKPLTFPQRLRVMAAVGTSVAISPDDARELARLMDANLATAKAALIKASETHADARQTLIWAVIFYAFSATLFVLGAFQ